LPILNTLKNTNRHERENKKMPRINTREADRYIAELKPFTSNGAISGEWAGPDYVVRSYSTAIAVITPDSGTAILNGARYSNTTSRHQSETRHGVSRLTGYQVTELKEPEAFTELTGHNARLRGANGWR
jgi:hypothetical protein